MSDSQQKIINAQFELIKVLREQLAALEAKHFVTRLPPAKWEALWRGLDGTNLNPSVESPSSVTLSREVRFGELRFSPGVYESANG